MLMALLWVENPPCIPYSNQCSPLHPSAPSTLPFIVAHLFHLRGLSLMQVLKPLVQVL